MPHNLNPYSSSLTRNSKMLFRSHPTLATPTEMSSQQIGDDHRISIQQEGKRRGSSSLELNLHNWPLPYLRNAGPAGWVNCFYLCACTMPWAQNMAAEGSILLWRRNTLTIWVKFIYGDGPPREDDFMDLGCPLILLRGETEAKMSEAKERKILLVSLQSKIEYFVRETKWYEAENTENIFKMFG